MTTRPPSEAQVNYAIHLVQQAVQAGDLDAKKAPTEKAVRALDGKSISALIDGLKKKRGEPVWYANGQFNRWKKASETHPMKNAAEKTAGDIFDDFGFGDMTDVPVSLDSDLRWKLEKKLGETAKLLTAAPMFSGNVRNLIGDRVSYFIRSKAWFVYIDEPAPQAVAKAKRAQKKLRGTRSVRADQPILRGRTLYVGSNDGKTTEVPPMHKAARNQKIIEAPHNFFPVKVLPPQAKRKEFPFEGFIDFQGLKIDVENKAGSTRRGTGPEGDWSTYMHSAYGEIRGTEGTDGDKLDVYVGENHDSPVVVVIHQHNPWDGKYDEDKVMIGFDSVEEAIGAYKKQYDRPGFYLDGKHTAMNIGKFWRWCHDKNNKGKKVSAQATPPDMQVENRKGWAFLKDGGDIATLTATLNAQMVRRVPPPGQVPKVRGAHKAFSFHWSNAQAKWDVIMIREFPWGIDGAEFILFTGKAAASPLGKTWSLAEMRYVAKGLNKHPGYASSPESARMADAAKRVAGAYLSKMAAPKSIPSNLVD